MAKLLLVIDCLGSGGAQRQLVSLATYFKRQGHVVEFYVYHPHLNHFESDLRKQNIKIHCCHKPNRFSLKPIFTLVKLLRKESYNAALAFLHTPGFYLESAYALYRCFGGKKMPIVFSERQTYNDSRPLSMIFKLSQQGHRLCSTIVANSYHQSEKMVREFPWMATKFTTIYNGLNQKAFSVTHEKQKNEPYILSIGRVVEYKNYLNTALALVHYKKHWGEPPAVIWVGKIFETPSNLVQYEKVKALLTTHDLSDKLKFIGETNNVQQYYSQAEALIHPSFIEGFSNVVMEACYNRLPLLLGNIGDHQHLLSSYNAGMIFDVNSPEVLPLLYIVL